MTAASPPTSPAAYARSTTSSNGEYPSSPLTVHIQQGLERRNSAGSIRRKSVPVSPIHGRQQSYPLNDIDEISTHPSHYPSPEYMRMQGKAQQEYQEQLPHFSGQFSTRVTSMQSNDSRDLQTPSPDLLLSRPAYDFQEPLPSPSFKPQHIIQDLPMPQPQAAIISSGESNRSSKSSSNFYTEGMTESPVSSGEESTTTQLTKLQYHDQQFAETPNGSSPSLGDQYGGGSPYSGGSSQSLDEQGRAQCPDGQLLAPHAAYRKGPRPVSTAVDGRGLSPNQSSPHLRAVSGHSYDSRRSSYIDLTQPAHIQQQHRQMSQVSPFDNKHLQTQVGAFASLLSSKQTLEMYRANAKKTQDPLLQYELALFMIQLAQQQPQQDGAVSPGSSHARTSGSSGPDNSPYIDPNTPLTSRKELLREARAILERISPRLPQAQYYLADAFSSGLFNKGKEESEKAFPLFVAASKHGHAEAGYRAALCYEFGWGCRKDPLKAVQFFRHAASKSHPGAMTRLGVACLRSDLGLQGQYREGLKWLKRATEIADEQYPSAPYELGLLHELGYGESVLPDPSYSAQLFTQAAELGHADASFRMGDSYEHGKLNCPRDPALSVHFYTGAAQRGHPMAMMALCAWYLVGAEPVLEKNEEEAYAWATKASEFGLPKAEYAVGYFTEMGIGCRRDPLEANVWYVRAADHGDERAIARLKIINEAASGGNGNAGKKAGKKKGTPAKIQKTLEKKGTPPAKIQKTLEKKAPDQAGDKGDCTIM